MAVGIAKPILQIVGYQNSGKTTVVEKLVTKLTNSGIRCGTIKHHGHGGAPESSDTRKDSYRHRKAGAVVSAVEGSGELQLHLAKESWKLDEIVNLYHQFDLDFIIIEGFKVAPYRKVVLIREEKELDLLKKVDNIFAIISWIPLSEEIKSQYQVFLINQEDEYLTLFTTLVRD